MSQVSLTGWRSVCFGLIMWDYRETDSAWKSSANRGKPGTAVNITVPLIISLSCDTEQWEISKSPRCPEPCNVPGKTWTGDHRAESQYYTKSIWFYLVREGHRLNDLNMPESRMGLAFQPAPASRVRVFISIATWPMGACSVVSMFVNDEHWQVLASQSSHQALSSHRRASRKLM